MDIDFLHDREGVLSLIKEKLARISVNYARQMEVIHSHNRKGEPWQPAGVLLPLCFKDISGTGTASREEFVLQLIRRSSAVAQGGDLSGPGGMLSPRLDGLFKYLLLTGAIPALRGYPRVAFKGKGSREFTSIVLCLANALRESWEEIRLNPWNVEFLGPLPFQNLILFTRTIFPVVGYVKKDRRFRPNEEVDQVVEIPLAAFFREESYGVYCVSNSADGSASSFESPCLIWNSPDGIEDILWGATLRIIMDFLLIVFDFRPAANEGSRRVTKTLSADYMKGYGTSETGRSGHPR